MLFIALLLGTGATAGLYRYWVQSYYEQVLEPNMQQQLETTKAAIQLFAYHKAELASNHIAQANKLLTAFANSDKKKRNNQVHDELNVIYSVHKDLKTAAMIAAVDMEGLAFVQANNPNWSRNWKKIRPVQQALKGSPSHGFVTFNKRPYLFLALPIIQKEKMSTTPDIKADSSPSGAHPCPKNKMWYCWRPCLKRIKKKCAKRAEKKHCYCRKMRAWQIAKLKKEQEARAKAQKLALAMKKKERKIKRSRQ